VSLGPDLYIPDLEETVRIRGPAAGRLKSQESREQRGPQHGRRFGHWLFGGTGGALVLMEILPAAALAIAVAIPLWFFAAGFCSGAFRISRGEFRRRLFDFTSELLAPHLMVELEGSSYRSPPALVESR